MLNRSEVIVLKLTNKQTQTNKQTPLKTSNLFPLCYAGG